MSWWWRTKPRSIARTIQWFADFANLKEQNWNETSDKTSGFRNQKIHPIRRLYIYNAHREEDEKLNSLSLREYLSGSDDKKETESNGRNDKITFEFFGFGFVNKKGIIKVTRVGERIQNNKFDSEDFLKQLLKLQFPNPVSPSLKGFDTDDFVFPLEILSLAIDKYGYLNRSEVALLFGCANKSKINNAFEAISYFRQKYQALGNKTKTNEVKVIFKDAFVKGYGELDNKVDSYYDYAEAFCRCLLYTGIFKATGRSIATQISVPDYSKIKFDKILTSYTFQRKTFTNINEYMEWFGDTDSTNLPWDDVETRKQIIEEKLRYLSNLYKEKEIASKYGKFIGDDVERKVKRETKGLAKATTITELKDLENDLVNFITSLNERKYIETYAQSKEARKNILKTFDDILRTIDMGALWLEVNTWKSLLAIRGEKEVIRHFEVEEDLTPKSFAPGIGNTPDMEMHSGNYIIIPEVSLMTGVRQWEHEASSVIDHVLSYINKNDDKKIVRGLFISSSLNIRTKWQFFILSKESWVGKPVPVIPLTINQYKNIVSVVYKKNLAIEDFIKAIESIYSIALKAKNYEEWIDQTRIYVENWGKGEISIS